MTKKPAARRAAVAVLIAGLVLSRLAGNGAGDPLPPVKPSPAITPAFEIRWHQGHLQLTGHTQSVQHEQNLLQLAKSAYPQAILSTEFEPLGVVPEFWADMTGQVLYLLAETDSSTAQVSTDSINIRGVTGQEFDWASRLGAVQASVPSQVTLKTDTVFVNASIEVLEVCRRAFENFDVGAINFEESSIVFRSSAYPRLQRVIALAATCPDSRISITGHTDASGPEPLNQQLSLERARAVGDYLTSGGIDENRLLISGRGSLAPVADNATRYGRSLNRRIEIALMPWQDNDGLLGRR